MSLQIPAGLRSRVRKQSVHASLRGWRLEDAVADSWSVGMTGQVDDASRRFVRPDQLPVIKVGDYRIVLCAFVRDSSPDMAGS